MRRTSLSSFYLFLTFFASLYSSQLKTALKTDRLLQNEVNELAEQLSLVRIICMRYKTQTNRSRCETACFKFYSNISAHYLRTLANFVLHHTVRAHNLTTCEQNFKNVKTEVRTRRKLGKWKTTIHVARRRSADGGVSDSSVFVPVKTRWVLISSAFSRPGTIRPSLQSVVRPLNNLRVKARSIRIVSRVARWPRTRRLSATIQRQVDQAARPTRPIYTAPALSLALTSQWRRDRGEYELQFPCPWSLGWRKIVKKIFLLSDNFRPKMQHLGLKSKNPIAQKSRGKI